MTPHLASDSALAEAPHPLGRGCHPQRPPWLAVWTAPAIAEKAPRSERWHTRSPGVRWGAVWSPARAGMGDEMADLQEDESEGFLNEAQYQTGLQQRRTGAVE